LGGFDRRGMLALGGCGLIGGGGWSLMGVAL
jgi:hypothetical protein